MNAAGAARALRLDVMPKIGADLEPAARAELLAAMSPEERQEFEALEREQKDLEGKLQATKDAGRGSELLAKQRANVEKLRAKVATLEGGDDDTGDEPSSKASKTDSRIERVDHASSHERMLERIRGKVR